MENWSYGSHLVCVNYFIAFVTIIWQYVYIPQMVHRHLSVSVLCKPISDIWSAFWIFHTHVILYFIPYFGTSTYICNGAPAPYVYILLNSLRELVAIVSNCLNIKGTGVSCLFYIAIPVCCQHSRRCGCWCTSTSIIPLACVILLVNSKY